MRRAAIASAACLAMTTCSAAFADDVNRTGQPQAKDSGKAGAASKGDDANTMGGATTERTLPSEQFKQLPHDDNKSNDKKTNNSEPASPSTGEC
ncbi:hypothetical protein [Hyphomicrobium sp.]|uniref:hypothetical protein n=1 Tax=Hyphomicrobium sp. TaxID=82 RepID=UPI001D85B5E4|nr:hypothetical protein [Hyphomicrobium sp.]MBY0559524.1 hypothetical protein [Hyphomicrobium sp.]